MPRAAVQSGPEKPQTQAPPEPYVAPVALANTRAQEIKDFCQKQGIESLVHFTRTENIGHIFTHGLVSRIEVDRWREKNEGAFPLVCEKLRNKDYRDAICLSISFPNYKMFHEYRQQGGEWVVIRLYASILWELQCAFCYRNAASEYVRRTDMKKRQSVGALKAMFADIPEGLRAKLGIPDRYTTDPQAEVLVLETIHIKYIESVFY